MPSAVVARPVSSTVADAMITDVTRHDASVTVGEVRRLFANDHVHAAVIVECGKLLAVVDRCDVEGDLDVSAPAVAVGRRLGRIVSPEADPDQVRRFLLASGRRRLAVVDPDGTFRGLLCLKRSRSGFCSDHDTRARRDERAAGYGPR